MKHINYRHNQYYGKSYQKHISENQHSVPSFSKTLSCLIQLHTAIGDRQCTKNHHIQTVYEQARYEVHEEFIVSLANAGAQPHTMMIETHDTIVAYIAMRSTLWSENHACFTEFEPIEHILIDIKVENPFFFAIDVCILPIYCLQVFLIKVLNE